MGKTKIDWTDYSVNPVRGLCPMDCKDNRGKSYCYARRMHKRFNWDETIRYDKDWPVGKMPKKPSRIFVGSTMELFGSWIKYERVDDIFKTVESFPRHTFIFLTKQPQNLPKEFPANCWVGISAPTLGKLKSSLPYFSDVQAKVKFISFEPLFSQMWEERLGGFSKRAFLESLRYYDHIDWLIIGQHTPICAYTTPKAEWIRDIVEAADGAKIPVFLKNNLWQLIYTEGIKYKSLDWGLNNRGAVRQEFPK